ncbi:flagellin lysine-N-methylase [Romboutsia sp.]|uniref:flagellin lysine-N-methylase n=1 Tax=Romboutsia sp. TaxID=1965302 RepID=UPI003F3E6666
MEKCKVLVPEYYNEFKCIGNKCEDHCCKGWSITIDKDTYMKYKKTKNVEFRNKLNNSINRNRKSGSESSYGKIKLIDDVCPMFSEEGLCEVYINLGPDNMCNTCKTYPRTYNKVDDIIEKSLTLSCIEVAKKALLKESGIEFNLDLDETEDIRISKSIKVEKSKKLEEKYFNELRVFCISLIQNRKYTIEERLAILGLFFNHINNNKEENNLITDSIDSYTRNIENGVYSGLLNKFDLENKVDAQLEFLTSTFAKLINNNKITNERYRNNLKNIIDTLKLNDGDVEDTKTKFIEAYDKYYKTFIRNKEYILENYLVNYMFSNLFPLSEMYLLDTYLNMMVQFSILKMNIIGVCAHYKEDMDIDKLLVLIQSFTMSLGHDRFLVSNIHKHLIDNNLNTVAHIMILMGR